MKKVPDHLTIGIIELMTENGLMTDLMPIKNTQEIDRIKDVTSHIQINGEIIVLTIIMMIMMMDITAGVTIIGQAMGGMDTKVIIMILTTHQVMIGNKEEYEVMKEHHIMMTTVVVTITKIADAVGTCQ